jgi:DNA repair protein RecO (recombination protein O)
VPQYREDGVVLRLHKLGEADRIVTIFTRRSGPVRAVAKGIRRTSSRFGARLEPFSHVDAQFYTGRTLDVITQVETIEPYGARIAPDYPRYTAGTTILEMAERLTEEREPALKLYLLLLGALRTLAEGEHAPTLVLDAFLLRAMAVSGWEPALNDCAKCGAAGPHRSFSVPSGGAVCTTCRPPGSVAPKLEVLQLMWALMRGDWLTCDTSDPATRRDASGLVAAHLQWHLERGLRSLHLVDRG